MSQAVVNPARKRRGRLTVCGMFGFAVTVGLRAAGLIEVVRMAAFGAFETLAPPRENAC
jgi:hypothetical protein